MDESYVRDSFARLNESRRRLADATRERIAKLSRAVADCERFEKQMADIQQWSAHVSTLLDLRKSGDVSALDVPDEYKVCYLTHFQQEFTLAHPACFPPISFFSASLSFPLVPVRF
ncbi:hypothetical protein ANCDUO_20714 [Ancylostoma duodenale]|uniref:Uncharacterized protein n=1 Tax=Ancylostoma duodenale TaxID=51022 RepID=A0A0C2CHC2_9BILA|nr:hypothetical protein ANCDUO_20714 [Ancylostoma duodenale]